MATQGMSAVNLGNLRSDLKSDDLKNLILHLFREKLGIQIGKDDITINYVNRQPYAIVNVFTAKNVQIVLEKLSTFDARTNIRFNFASLVGHAKLMVQKYQSPDSNSSQEKCYILGQSLGSETRHREFKKGGGSYGRKYLREDVGRYVCGFLNTGEEGCLLIGVEDSGIVTGIECSHRVEDDYRQTIDQALREIQPAIFPNMYSVQFVSIVQQHDPQGPPIADVKVIQITVAPTGSHDQLYEFSGVVYIRRDGSMQQAKPSEIQEWTKRKHQEKIRNLEQQVVQKDQQLAQKDQKITEKDQRIGEKDQRLTEKDHQIVQKDQLLAQKDEQMLDARIQHQQALSEAHQKKKSKVCSVM